jgi:hypothetical protein
MNSAFIILRQTSIVKRALRTAIGCDHVARRSGDQRQAFPSSSLACSSYSRAHEQWHEGQNMQYALSVCTYLLLRLHGTEMDGGEGYDLESVCYRP